MRRISRRSALLSASGLLLAACAPAPPPTPKPTAKPAASAWVYVISKASPNVVIDAATNKVVRSKDVPGIKSWGWNDDNNYADGKNLWLTAHGPEEDDAEMLLLDLDSLEVTRRIALGKEKQWIYIGKPSKRGTLLASKHASGQVAVIDTGGWQITQRIDLRVSPEAIYARPM